MAVIGLLFAAIGIYALVALSGWIRELAAIMFDIIGLLMAIDAVDSELHPKEPVPTAFSSISRPLALASLGVAMAALSADIIVLSGDSAKP